MVDLCPFIGAEFATGQFLGALVMIATVWLGSYHLDLMPGSPLTATNGDAELSQEIAQFSSWSKVLFTPTGWGALLKFIMQEIGRFAPSFLMGILLGGFVPAAGLKAWWPLFADVFGHRTLGSDFVNAAVGPFVAMAVSLSAVGNLPLVHGLFKADGLAYPGIISLCLANVLHSRDIKTYARWFGWRNALKLVALFYTGAVLGGLGSTWIYAAAFGFRPSLPPVRLAGKVF